MSRKILPLKEVNINEIFNGSDNSTYEIPIYQRNYAWEKDEIFVLIQDIYDAYKKNGKKVYYIGTLVSYHKGDRVFEVIDGQQRLTTIRLVLGALGVKPQSRLTYRARKKSDDTLKAISSSISNVNEKDLGIEQGYKHAVDAIKQKVSENEISGFREYFLNFVHIIHYQVPKDIDLNHYFEIMNSRGEQLEKHEIVKANLMGKLSTDSERVLFNHIWESCSELSIYIQQVLLGVNTEEIFGKSLYSFLPKSFDDLLKSLIDSKEENGLSDFISINDILNTNNKEKQWFVINEQKDRKDSFLPIIDFPNFLLIVLKITKMSDPSFNPIKFSLDDKELLNEFKKVNMQCEDVKKFAFNLLKARFFLDNYIVHHSKEEDILDSNPWKLQVWHKDNDTQKPQLKNLCDDKTIQDRLVHLLSMFEVSFTARQRKNYLFYSLFYLLTSHDGDIDTNKFIEFVEDLADKYFYKVYLDKTKLNSINTPLPDSFDELIMSERKLDLSSLDKPNAECFVSIYGNGTDVSNGVPLFVFNYLDYKIWKKYDEQLRGEKLKEGSQERKAFFEALGCTDFGLKVFDQFYFSRTRRSLEHYYPQAMANDEKGFLNKKQINCIGNYAMIGSEANSSGSNWSPKTKLDHYLDASGKINQISVASLKFMVMMQLCRDKQKWDFEEITLHQQKMIDILL